MTEPGEHVREAQGLIDGLDASDANERAVALARTAALLEAALADDAG